MSYFEKLDAHATATQAKALNILDLYRAGKITKTEAIATMSAMLGKANLRAAALADFSLAATITLETGIPTAATGVSIRNNSRVAGRAIKQILDTPTAKADMVMRIGRLARSEPLGAAVRASDRAMAAQPLVEGWVRKLDPDPCQLCRWWWRDGQVWPKNHPMPHHKGCQCIKEPVFTEQAPRTRTRKYKVQPVLGG
ncbi:hypothetical protein [Glutamicibacter arilaitensis]|uniref:hypothetical protein n=1 Tax=Glutamicibacter arilaitensis TaxID=256701 RepID=UPI003A915FAD